MGRRTGAKQKRYICTAELELSMAGGESPSLGQDREQPQDQQQRNQREPPIRAQEQGALEENVRDNPRPPQTQQQTQQSQPRHGAIGHQDQHHHENVHVEPATEVDIHVNQSINAVPQQLLDSSVDEVHNHNLSGVSFHHEHAHTRNQEHSNEHEHDQTNQDPQIQRTSHLHHQHHQPQQQQQNPHIENGMVVRTGPKRFSGAGELEPHQLLFNNEPWDPLQNKEQSDLLTESISRILRARVANSVAKLLELYRYDTVLVFLRLSHSRGVRHAPARMELTHAESRKHKRDGLPCILCCTVCENWPRKSHPSRKPACTKFWCVNCIRVPLCCQPKQMWGWRSCFEVWHSRGIEEVWDGLLDICPCRNPDAIYGEPFVRKTTNFDVEASAIHHERMVPDHFLPASSATFAAHAGRKRPREDLHSSALTDTRESVGASHRNQ